MLSVSQYKKALPSLSKPRRNILLKLYAYGPFRNSNYIAAALDYPNFNSANVQIGTFGRVIGEMLSEVPEETYMHKGKERPSYFSFVHDYYEEGWDLVPNLQKAMENLGWTKELTADDYERLETEEKAIDRSFFKDGKLIQVSVNRYERDQKARKQCLKVHGNKCIGCELDFKKMYGPDINDIIHVHHTMQLSQVGKETIKNVIKDLVPLCPNCHAVVHSTPKLMSVEDLKRRVKKYKG
jgi:predicted HNH restriction endonuclease